MPIPYNQVYHSLLRKFNGGREITLRVTSAAEQTRRKPMLSVPRMVHAIVRHLRLCTEVEDHFVGRAHKYQLRRRWCNAVIVYPYGVDIELTRPKDLFRREPRDLLRPRPGPDKRDGMIHNFGKLVASKPSLLCVALGCRQF